MQKKRFDPLDIIGVALIGGAVGIWLLLQLSNTDVPSGLCVGFIVIALVGLALATRDDRVINSLNEAAKKHPKDKELADTALKFTVAVFDGKLSVRDYEQAMLALFKEYDLAPRVGGAPPRIGTTPPVTPDPSTTAKQREEMAGLLAARLGSPLSGAAFDAQWHALVTVYGFPAHAWAAPAPLYDTQEARAMLHVGLFAAIETDTRVGYLKRLRDVLVAMIRYKHMQASQPRTTAVQQPAESAPPGANTPAPVTPSAADAALAAALAGLTTSRVEGEISSSRYHEDLDALARAYGEAQQQESSPDTGSAAPETASAEAAVTAQPEADASSTDALLGEMLKLTAFMNEGVITRAQYEERMAALVKATRKDQKSQDET